MFILKPAVFSDGHVRLPEKGRDGELGAANSFWTFEVLNCQLRGRAQE